MFILERSIRGDEKMTYTDEEVLEIIEQVRADTPLDGIFEDDARYNWPRRWRELEERFGGY